MNNEGFPVNKINFIKSNSNYNFLMNVLLCAKNTKIKLYNGIYQLQLTHPNLFKVYLLMIFYNS